MGIILDIVDKIVPETQELMERDGLKLKEALEKVFLDNGYIIVRKSYETKENHIGENILGYVDTSDALKNT